MSTVWQDYAVHSEREIKGFFGPFRWLSNFWLCPVRLDGILYRCAENAYQAHKTDDMDQRRVVATMDPLSAKEWGRKGVKLPRDWEEIRHEAMMAVIFAKFHQNLELRERLIATYPATLEETNHWGDKIWGVDYLSGEGENHLGKILEKVRSLWV